MGFEYKLVFCSFITTSMALLPPPSDLVFKVKRRQHELLYPSKETPFEVKPLSDIDDQECRRYRLPLMHFYNGELALRGKDPVMVIREALQKTLVFFYPLAGRLHEGPNRKLMVDCNGEGIVFIEADANVSLAELGHNLHPPFPCSDELLPDVTSSAGVTDSPLMSIQVTRLRCGGFVFGLLVIHNICGGQGLAQFLTAVGEVARGADEPSLRPVWGRDALYARNPPRVTRVHREYDEVEGENFCFSHDMANVSFFFGEDEMKRLRMHAPSHLRGGATTFEILVACLWRCRTAAISVNPDEDVYLLFPVNVRKRFPLPAGYYGNACTDGTAVATARQLCSQPLGYAIDLVRKAKDLVDTEHVRSVLDLTVIKGRPNPTLVRCYVVSDIRRLGYSDIDFGSGAAAYGGLLVPELHLDVFSYFQTHTISEGEKGIIVPISLPKDAMGRFIEELKKIIKGPI